ncbi:hypothetical protein FHG87_019951 [Trinorchestia longiramus]|nr:hypothetical protein FHG87_019951 [Trinorchestia longiramus]
MTSYMPAPLHSLGGAGYGGAGYGGAGYGGAGYGGAGYGGAGYGGAGYGGAGYGALVVLMSLEKSIFRLRNHRVKLIFKRAPWPCGHISATRPLDQRSHTGRSQTWLIKLLALQGTNSVYTIKIMNEELMFPG